MKIKLLEAIGMNWTTPKESAWQRNYVAAKAYFEENGDLLVPVNYVDKNGFKLGVWIANLRTYRRVGSNTKSVTPEKIKLLNSIGMVWNVADVLWEQYYTAASKYYEEHGNLNVPSTYVTDDGIKLGGWISSVKSARLKNSKNYQLSDEQIEALNRIGMDWRNALDIRWEENYNRAKAYREAFGDLNIPPTFLTEDGQKLGKWIREQRKRRRLGRITQEQIELLDQIGMNWDGHPTNLSWKQWYQFAKAYYEEHGDLEVSPNYKVNGYWLGKWISNQREIRNGKREGQTLSKEQIRLLDAIKMRWRKQSEIAWLQQFERAEKYYSIHGTLKASSKSSDPLEKTVGAWLTVQRRRLKNGELTTEQLSKLQTLQGFSIVA